VTIEKPVDQVQIARPAASCADSESSRKLRLRTCSERRRFLVPYVNSLNRGLLTKRVRETIQRVARNAIDALNSRLVEN
jgi:hypothetical protein